MSQSIEICDYTPDWAREFRVKATGLRQALQNVAIRIDHIGSTAIVGLAAKPIVDIQISVVALEPMSAYLEPMRELGDIWRSDNLERTKRYFREAPQTKRTHIHIRKFGSWHEQFALLFRDYVRQHDDAQRRYALVKRQLAFEFRNDRQRYTEGKTAIIWELMQEASGWAAITGWEPGPSDA